MKMVNQASSNLQVATKAYGIFEAISQGRNASLKGKAYMFVPRIRSFCLLMNSKNSISLSKKTPIHIIHVTIFFLEKQNIQDILQAKKEKEKIKHLVLLPKSLSLKLCPNKHCGSIDVVLWNWAFWLGFMHIREKSCFQKM